MKTDIYRKNDLMTNTICRLCNVYYRDSTHKQRHESTKKHRQKLAENSKSQGIIAERFHCDKCCKNYKFKSGLSRHKVKCHSETDSDVNGDGDGDGTLVKNNEMMTIMKDILKTQLNILSQQQNQTSHGQGVYINKQVVNVNVFLNEYCNNAISLIDFVNNLNLTLDDLKETKSLGYVDGVSNILVKKLVSLKPTERPIHCDGIGNEDFEFYVKEESNWMKDVGNKKIDWSIDNVSKKQIETLKLWETVHPNWMHSDKETELYLEMVRLCMGGSSPEEIDKNKRAIKSALANGVRIEDMMTLCK